MSNSDLLGPIDYEKIQNKLLSESIAALQLSDGTIVISAEGSQEVPALQLADGTLVTQDTGLHTNPEKYRGDNHWQTPEEVEVAAAGAGGEETLGVVVPANYQRRIVYLKLRHAGSANTVVSLTETDGGTTVDSWDVPAETTRVVSVQMGWLFAAGEHPGVQTSDVTDGSTFVTAIGLQEEV